MSFSEEISLYNDLMVVEAIATDPHMYKTAGLITDMASKVKDYVGSHIDPSDKLGSLFNILGPGAVSLAFRAMGLGWFGMLAGLAMTTFHINVSGIISTIWDGLKAFIHKDSPITSAHVDAIVNGAVQQHAGADTGEARTAEQVLKDARLLKIALISYEQDILSLTKEAATPKGILSTKSGTVSVLGKILSVLFKVALSSAGLMVTGDVINKFLGRPNGIDGNATPSGTAPAPTVSRSHQTKFPPNPGYMDQTHSGAWGVSVSNDPASIEAMLVNFAKETYSGLNGKENAITSSTNFQKIMSDIIWYNHASAGDKVVIIPKEFKSKKDIVDYFIDDVAKSSP